MGFHEVQFPLSLSYGTKGGPTFNTKVVALVSGQVQAIPRWGAPQFGYDVAETIRSVSDLATLANFYVARLGPANGFRFSDPFHYTTASDNRSVATNLDSVLGVGDGTTTQFQLTKTYSSGGYNVYKNLYKPVAGTTKIAIAGVDQGAAGGTWNIDTTTGIVTFGSAPTLGATITGGSNFDMPVMFAKELDTNLMFNFEAFELGSIDSIPLVELISPSSRDEEFFYGSGSQVSFSTPISISSLSGRALTLIPASALIVYLPSATTYPLGGPHWYIYNNSAFTITFKVGQTTQFTLTGGSKCEIVNMLSSGVRTWVAF